VVVLKLNEYNSAAGGGQQKIKNNKTGDLKYRSFCYLAKSNCAYGKLA
jgi:hypothetical protein